MKQRTIGKVIEFSGIGLHSGRIINVRIEPMEADNGIIFYRKDKGISIKLTYKNVIDTKLATVIGFNNVKISTIEHLLSALYAFGIDNLRIVLDGDEIPIMDGSASPFVMLIKEAGIKELNKNKKIIVIKKMVEVKKDNKFVRIEPSKEIMFDYTIEFEHPMIRRQQYKFKFDLEKYINEISRARTFGFLKDIKYLKNIGLVKGGELSNALVFDDKSILNDNLRYDNEPVRHKILDAIGDLSLLGYFYIGKYIAYKGSHELNNLLVKKIIETNSFEFVEINKEKNYFERYAYATI